MNCQPGIPPKLFRNEESLVFNKCLWYIFCNVNIHIMNQIIMPLSRNQILLHLPLQSHSLTFSTLLSVLGNWPVKIQKKLSCLWLPRGWSGYRHRDNFQMLEGGRSWAWGIASPRPFLVLHGCLHPQYEVEAPADSSLSAGSSTTSSLQ